MQTSQAMHDYSFQRYQKKMIESITESMGIPSSLLRSGDSREPANVLYDHRVAVVWDNVDEAPRRKDFRILNRRHDTTRFTLRPPLIPRRRALAYLVIAAALLSTLAANLVLRLF